MSVHEKIPYIQVEGENNEHSVTVYALTTCGFCRRAISHLKEKKTAFKYIYIDELPGEVKTELKNELRDKYQRSMVFPFLVVDEKEAVTGFVQEKWDELLA